MERFAAYLDFPLNRSGDRSAPTGAVARESPEIEALTRRLVAGEETAYRVFYGAYVDRLSRYLLVVTAGDEEAMREALQGMLARVVKNIRVFTNEAVFWSWLTVLARSALSDDRRKRRRYLAFLDRFTRHADTEESGLSAGQTGQRLADALERNFAALPAEDRQLLHAKYFERQTVNAIARQRQTTEKAIESRLGRVRRSLKRAMLTELKHDPHA
jgi:RNA polymerase sigma factor (sigma-70 family)